VSREQPLTSPEAINDVASKLAIECFGGVFDRL